MVTTIPLITQDLLYYNCSARLYFALGQTDFVLKLSITLTYSLYWILLLVVMPQDLWSQKRKTGT